MLTRRIASTGLAFFLSGLLLLPVGGALASCPDCDGDGEVSVADVIVQVAIALGVRPLDDCRSADEDASGTLTVDELVRAVAASLAGCPTATPTLSPTPVSTASSTPTATDGAPPTSTPSQAPTSSATESATPTPSLAATPTPTESDTPSPTPSTVPG
jgi:hypothetical protein